MFAHDISVAFFTICYKRYCFCGEDPPTGTFLGACISSSPLCRPPSATDGEDSAAAPSQAADCLGGLPHWPAKTRVSAARMQKRRKSGLVSERDDCGRTGIKQRTGSITRRRTASNSSAGIKFHVSTGACTAALFGHEPGGPRTWSDKKELVNIAFDTTAYTYFIPSLFLQWSS